MSYHSPLVGRVGEGMMFGFDVRGLSYCQALDEYCKRRGYKSWNSFLADLEGNLSVVWLKKQLRREWKLANGVKLIEEEINSPSGDTEGD